MRLIDRVLVLFLVCSSIYRIDFSGGTLGFSLTPALVTALSIIFIFIVATFTYPKIKVNKSIIGYSFLLALLSSWFIITVIPYDDFTQIKRLFLFSILVSASIAFSVLFLNTKNRHKILESFIKWSVRSYIGFCIVQIVFFMYEMYGLDFVEPIPFATLQPQTIGPYFPRLTGGFMDPSLGGFFLIFLYLLIKQFNMSKGYIRIVSALIFLTLSRSSIMTFILVVAMAHFWNFINNPSVKVSFKLSSKKLKALLISLFLLVSATLLIFYYTGIGEKLLTGIEARLGNEDNSTSIHFSLMQLATRLILDNPINFLKGYGFASSFLYTKEFFPLNIRYGNFHSELLTIQFESGLIGLLLYLSILLFPIVHHIRKRKVSLHLYLLMIIPAILLGGIFYQQYLFQHYWVMVAFVWCLPSMITQKKFVK